MKKKIGVLVLGEALAFGTSTGAWAQGGGAGGGAGGAGGGAAGTGAGGNQLVVLLESEVHLKAHRGALIPPTPTPFLSLTRRRSAPGTPGTSPGNSTH